MKRIISFLCGFFILITCSLGYVIQDNEYRDEELDYESGNEIGIYVGNSQIMLDANASGIHKYVKSYRSGQYTTIQVCSVGTNNSEATHKYKANSSKILVFNKSEIVSVGKPTCISNGSMTIRCKNIIETKVWGITVSKKECGKTATVILEKTGHSIDKHSIDGKCENCGEIHGKGELLKNESDVDNHYYACTFPDCDERIEEGHNYESGSWVCTICGKPDDRHKASNEWVEKDEYTHYRKCEVEGCDEEWEPGKHSGATHDDPVCTVCNEPYETHLKSTTMQNNETHHWYGCSFPGCKKPYDEEEHNTSEKPIGDSNGHYYICSTEGCGVKYGHADHVGGTHNDGGECTECGFKYKEHNKGEIDYDKDGHWYKCTGCSEPYSEKESHSGGTHENKGTCEKCGYKYEEHNKGDIDYDKDGHWYKCTGCSEPYNEKIPHLIENGKCKECGYIDDSHKPSDIWVPDGDKHYRKCIVVDCKEHKFDEAEHYGGNHDNNGICTDCKFSYQKHGEGVRDMDDTYHWYKCRVADCPEFYEKEEHKKTDPICSVEGHWHECDSPNCNYQSKVEPHIMEDKDGKRVCSICGYRDKDHIAKEEWSGDKKIHYKECQVDGCTEHSFDEGDHIGGKHSEGICEICNQVYQTHIEDTNKFNKGDEENHWYGCSFEGCQEVFKEEHQEGNYFEVTKTHHWLICKSEECGKIFNKEEHIDEDKNDICDVCRRDFINLPEKISIKKGEKGEEGYRELEKVGDSVLLEVECEPKEAILDFSQLEWSSSDPDIVVVSESGMVIALKEGVALVTVKLGKELKDSCAIFVGEEFKITISEKEMYEDEYIGLTTNFDNKGMKITWEIRNGDSELGEIEEAPMPDPEDPRKEIMGKVFHSAEDSAEDTVTIYATLGDSLKKQVKIKIVHKGGTHKNDGECTICGELYQEHKLGDYKYKDESGHWQECSYKDCKGKKFNEESHTGNTSCTKCKWKKQGGTGSGGTGSGGTGSGGTGSGGTGSGGTGSGGIHWVDTGDNENCILRYKSTGKAVYSGNSNLARKEPHNFVNGVCTKPESGCGARELDTCDHDKTQKNYAIRDDNSHDKICMGYTSIGLSCNLPISTEPHNFRPDDVCDDCGYKKGGGNGAPTMEYREADLYIKTKEYYVLEGAPITIDISDIVAVGGIKEFTWTMETIPDKEFSSRGEKESNDGTIVFYYEGDNNTNNKFFAKLNEPNIEKMAEEVRVTITLYTNYGQAASQTIKLIKAGPPNSTCIIRFDDTIYSVDDNELKIKVLTLYDDFSEEMIDAKGLPIYGIDEDIEIKVVPKSEDVIEITGDAGYTSLSDEPGHLITIPVNLKKPGSAVVDVSLGITYQWNSKYKVFKKDRKLFDTIYVNGAKTVSLNGEPPNPGVVVPDPGSGEEPGNGVGVLAAVGAGGLLLLLAVIGASMNKRR